MRPTGWTILFLLTLAQALPGQELSLAQALHRASDRAWANRAADATARARAAEAFAPYRGILPSLRVVSNYAVTTDPLGAFGFTLRQRAVTPAAFAPSTLNHPSATHDMGAALVLEQPLLNPDAWLGARAAGRASASARASADWTRASTALEVVRGYWGAVLAAAEVRTFEVALLAAESHQRQAEAMVRQGLATSSDALLASVKAGECRSRLFAARSRARLARSGLALLMGAPGDTAFLLPAGLPMPAPATADTTPRPRADVAAARLGREAAEADARRAALAYLPRLNGFGRLDWNTPDTPFGGRSAWTVGVELSWNLFSGGSELVDIRASRARRDAAREGAAAVEAQARLDLEAAREHVAVALARLAIATDAVSQAREAHRILGRKYEGGLASITELFDAAAAETATELERDGAAYDGLVAQAELERAMGSEVGS